MIRLTRLDGSEFYLNADHIQIVEATPDTHILLTNGQRYVVRETAEQVAEAFLAYKRRIFSVWARA
jgi:flagellar protein FlbD